MRVTRAAEAQRHALPERSPSAAGGGTLGPYQAGVYEALAERGVEPTWPAGISIATINSSGFFERQGLRALIADPGELSLADGRLRCRGETVDLVYNRLVDFSLEAEAHKVLREAYLADAVVLTPNPRNHALFADKRNLSLLLDSAAAEILGLHTAGHLAAVPRTHLLTAENADALWGERKGLFFKPAGGHGGKAVYRGDKITHRVWAEGQQGEYIAQELAVPTERRLRVDGELQALKLDVCFGLQK